MKQLYFIFIAILFLNISVAQVYVNDMDYVLGDVKQGFITNAITTTNQVDNLIKGFKTMKVNGIRIPIYADGVNPNVEMYDYFYNRAVEAGFEIFANPAQFIGGQRIACGILNGTPCTVLNNNARTIALINRIKEFAAQYPCKWINPLNEDGAPGATWSADQMTEIYKSLYKNLNGAELIGSGAWGIPASITVMNRTDIHNYISVATCLLYTSPSPRDS